MTQSISGVVRLLPSVIAMAGVILLSNILVQIPIDFTLTIAGQTYNLAELLTWGALSYPVAFLVTDTTNRIFGAASARKVVYFGFALGVILTLMVAFNIASEVAAATNTGLFDALLNNQDAFGMLRIALASGSAFLIAQLLDIAIFNKLRRATWWKAPTISSFFGSAVDTAIFFSLAFAATGLPWVNWAVGDFVAKLAMIAILLYPFKLLISIYPHKLKIA